MPGVLTVLVVLLAVGAGLTLWSHSIARGAEGLVPATGRMVRVDGGAIHLVESGSSSRPNVVLIHGLSGQLQHFTYALADLLSGDFHVIALDRPGAGHSTRDGDGLADPFEQARMIWEALDAVGVERPLLVGHSLGGTIALAMALLRPGAAAGLALITPLTHPQNAPDPMFAGLMVRSPTLRRLLGHTLAVPMARRTARQTLTQVFAPEPWPEDFVTRAGGALGLRPKGYIGASADLVAAQDALAELAARYGELRLPGGVLLASADTLLPPGEQGGPMAAFGFTIETLEGRGHMLPVTAPEDCARFIRSVAARAHASRI